MFDFAFVGGDKTFIRLFKNRAAYWWKKAKGGLGFSKTSLKTALNRLKENCYFNVENVILKQATGFPMGIDPAPFWENPFLYSNKEE